MLQERLVAAQGDPQIGQGDDRFVNRQVSRDAAAAVDYVVGFHPFFFFFFFSIIVFRRCAHA